MFLNEGVNASNLHYAPVVLSALRNAKDWKRLAVVPALAEGTGECLILAFRIYRKPID